MKRSHDPLKTVEKLTAASARHIRKQQGDLQRQMVKIDIAIEHLKGKPYVEIARELGISPGVCHERGGWAIRMARHRFYRETGITMV
jgi:hypothetical protein